MRPKATSCHWATRAITGTMWLRDDTPSEMSWGRGLTPRHAATQDGGMYAAKCLPMNPDDIGKQRYGTRACHVQA